jgi:hypothetical protein
MSEKDKAIMAKAVVVGNVIEKTETAADDKGINASPEDVDCKVQSGSSGEGDVEYVHGYPVIRNGAFSLHARGKSRSTEYVQN